MTLGGLEKGLKEDSITSLANNDQLDAAQAGNPTEGTESEKPGIPGKLANLITDTKGATHDEQGLGITKITYGALGKEATKETGGEIAKILQEYLTFQQILSKEQATLFELALVDMSQNKGRYSIEAKTSNGRTEIIEESWIHGVPFERKTTVTEHPGKDTQLDVWAHYGANRNTLHAGIIAEEDGGVGASVVVLHKMQGGTGQLENFPAGTPTINETYLKHLESVQLEVKQKSGAIKRETHIQRGIDGKALITERQSLVSDSRHNISETGTHGISTKLEIEFEE